ncbi:MAG: methyltransferase domain-containing protein [archaeon]|jgi:ubiquinone/menaquinone biosynthesis C-methylase UbiE
MSFLFIKNNSFLKNVFVNYLRPNRRKRDYTILKKNLNKKEKILNLGAGTCLLDEIFLKKGFLIDSMDIYDGSMSELVKPVIYDGKKIPSKNNNYHSILLLSVLHHVRTQEDLLDEAKRVAKKIIIQEDVFEGNYKKFLFSVFDNLINLDFNLNQNYYNSVTEWEKIFKEHGLLISSINIRKRFLGINQATFVLNKIKN